MVLHVDMVCLACFLAEALAPSVAQQARSLLEEAAPTTALGAGARAGIAKVCKGAEARGQSISVHMAQA